MSQTDVTGVAEAVSDIQIVGPSVTAADTLTTETAATGTDADVTVSINGGPEVPLETLTDAVLKTPPGKTVELFDKGAYLNAVVIDGQAADKIRISFSGSIDYEAADPTGRALFEKLALGKDIDLRVAGTVAKKHGAWKLAGAGTDNEREEVTGQVGVKVTDLYVLSPEEL